MSECIQAWNAWLYLEHTLRNQESDAEISVVRASTSLSMYIDIFRVNSGKKPIAEVISHLCILFTLGKLALNAFVGSFIHPVQNCHVIQFQSFPLHACCRVWGKLIISQISDLIHAYGIYLLWLCVIYSADFHLSSSASCLLRLFNRTNWRYYIFHDCHWWHGISAMGSGRVKNVLWLCRIFGELCECQTIYLPDP